MLLTPNSTCETNLAILQHLRFSSAKTPTKTPSSWKKCLGLLTSAPSAKTAVALRCTRCSIVKTVSVLNGKGVLTPLFWEKNPFSWPRKSSLKAGRRLLPKVPQSSSLKLKTKKGNRLSKGGSCISCAKSKKSRTTTLSPCSTAERNAA